MGYGSQGTKKDREKASPVHGKAPRFNDVQFVNYELDTATQRACKEWEIDETGVFDEITRLVSDGYSLQLKWDGYSNAFAAFLQQKTPDGPNSGLILTGRGSSPFKAAKQVLYKHAFVMGGRWENFVSRKPIDEIDD